MDSERIRQLQCLNANAFMRIANTVKKMESDPNFDIKRTQGATQDLIGIVGKKHQAVEVSKRNAKRRREVMAVTRLAQKRKDLSFADRIKRENAKRELKRIKAGYIPSIVTMKKYQMDPRTINRIRVMNGHEPIVGIEAMSKWGVKIWNKAESKKY